MSSTTPILRRALLYVPSSMPRMIKKSLSITTDNVTYDLEDSVTPDLKPAARSALVKHLSSLVRPPDIGEIAVRINDVRSSFAEQDLKQILQQPNVDALVVPKVNSAADLHFVQDFMRSVLPDRHPVDPFKSTSSLAPIKILALIESARAVTDLSSICAATPYLDGLIFAAEDFAFDLSLTRTTDLTEFFYARCAIATAARAFNLSSTIDLVCQAYKGKMGPEILRKECHNGKSLGYNGKQCIHPDQVEAVQMTFTPALNEVEWAVRISIAGEKAAARGRGAWSFETKMVDAPVIGKAKALLAKAARCGFDIDMLRKKWQDEEPSWSGSMRDTVTSHI